MLGGFAQYPYILPETRESYEHACVLISYASNRELRFEDTQSPDARAEKSAPRFSSFRVRMQFNGRLRRNFVPFSSSLLSVCPIDDFPFPPSLIVISLLLFNALDNKPLAIVLASVCATLGERSFHLRVELCR